MSDPKATPRVPDSATDAPPKRPPTVVRVTWAGDHRFDAAGPNGVASRIDASGETGPGPVSMLLSALAACASVDVVDILTKRRTPPVRLAVEVTGDRAQAVPARVSRVRLDYQVDGPDLDRANVERAVDLAVSKYCSVRGSLDPIMPIEFAVTLNGDPGRLLPIGALAG